MKGEKCNSIQYIEAYNKKMNKRNAILSGISDFIKYVFYAPLSIATSVMSAFFKFCGTIFAIGMPFGLYCVYKIIVELSRGIALENIEGVAKSSKQMIGRHPLSYL